MKFYEKVKDLSKRTLALYLVFSIVFMTLVYDLIAPLDVYAKVLDDNPPDGHIAVMGEEDSMQNNWGTIDDCHGQVENNMGTIGYIGDGENDPGGDGGFVTNNYGTVNTGSVTNNYGVANGESNVEHNWASGTVNSGWVDYNHHGTEDETKRDGLGDDVTTAATDHESAIQYMEWNAGPKPIPPKYVAPVKEDNETYNESVKQTEDEDASQANYDNAKKNGFDTLKFDLSHSGDVSLQNSYTIDMGSTVSYTPDMLKTLISANDNNVSVSMIMKTNGREFTFTIPAGANMTLISQYLATMDFTSQGYSFLFNLIPGSSLSYIDDNGYEVVMTNNMTSAQADKLLEQAAQKYRSMSSAELYAYCESIYGADFAKMLNSATPKRTAGDEDDDDDEASGSGSGTTEFFAAGSINPVGGEAGSGILGARTGNRVAGAGGTASGVLGVRSDDQSGSADSTSVSVSSEGNQANANTNNGTVRRISNHELPPDIAPSDDGSGMNWLWIMAAAAASVTGVYSYEKHKKKLAADAEAKKYKNQ